MGRWEGSEEENKRTGTEEGGAGHFCNWGHATQPAMSNWLATTEPYFLSACGPRGHMGNILISLMARSPKLQEELGSYGHSNRSPVGLPGQEPSPLLPRDSNVRRALPASKS